MSRPQSCTHYHNIPVSFVAGRCNVPLLTWKWFFGASILVGGLLFKVGVPTVSIVAGIAVAAAVTWRYAGRKG